MDMNKILQNLDSAVEGEYTPSKQESTDMKMILESFYDVAQKDVEGTESQQLDEIASVTMSGDSADEVAQLVKLMNDAGAPQAAPVGPQPTTMDAPVDMPADGPPDMPPMVTPKMMDDFDAEAEVVEDDYANEPDEKYDDHEKMTHDLSGGLNRRKNSYADAEDGDNPMSVETSIKEELAKMFKQKMSEKAKDTSKKFSKGDKVKVNGKDSTVTVPDGPGPLVGVKDVDGDTDMVKAKNVKKRSGDKDEEVEEAGKLKGGADDPCWKGYKMVGTKKKGGKEVPNCVPREDTEIDGAPVFENYVKPFMNKTPKQMVEMYDSQARTIIDRLSRERRSLAETHSNTAMHDVVIGQLRENLDAVSEAPYGRRSRSSFDIGRTGYGPGGDLGAADKRDFKRREMEVELGDEEPNNYAVSIGGKPWKVFRSQRAAQKAAATIKSKYGKDTKVYQTAAPANS